MYMGTNESYGLRSKVRIENTTHIFSTKSKCNDENKFKASYYRP